MSIALHEIDPPAKLALGQPISAEDFWRISQANPDMRLERSAQGELLIMSPTGFEGGGIGLDVAAELRNWALADGRGKAYGPNTGITLPDSSVRAADACWISWERINALAPRDRKGFAHIVPGFIIEVRSESDSLDDLRAKMNEWLVNGVELAWLIDPTRKAVEIYRASSIAQGQQPEIQEGHSAAYGEGPVGGFVLELGRIWS